jgi:hypothetical protein
MSRGKTGNAADAAGLAGDAESAIAYVHLSPQKPRARGE